MSGWFHRGEPPAARSLKQRNKTVQDRNNSTVQCNCNKTVLHRSYVQIQSNCKTQFYITVTFKVNVPTHFYVTGMSSLSTHCILCISFSGKKLNTSRNVKIHTNTETFKHVLPFSRGIRQGVVCLISGHTHFVVDLTSAFTGHWARHLGSAPSLCQRPDQHTWYSRYVSDYLSWTLGWKMRQSRSNSWNTSTVVKRHHQWKPTTTYYHYSNIIYKV